MSRGCGHSRLSMRNVNNFGEVLAIVCNQIYLKGGLQRGNKPYVAS